MKRDQVIFSWDPYTNPIIADVAGVVRFVDLVEDESVSEELDELTGLRQRVVIEDRDKKLHPHIEIWDEAAGSEDPRLRRAGWRAADRRGWSAHFGGNDHRQGQPRGVQDARHHGWLAARRGAVRGASAEGSGDDLRDRRRRAVRRDQARQARDLRAADASRRTIWWSDDTQEAQLYEVPAGKHLRVHEGDRVRAGDRLSEGPVNPHDILRIKGPRAVQEYLLNEVQEVYRLQGVKINDKHIGVIVRQMLQKVRVIDPGETEFLEGEHVDKHAFRDENERAKKKKLQPATSEPLLLGITKASLTTQSFVSAASFQETTRVLTDASIRGAQDDLLGLKENIIIGHLIPAGTGMYRYQEVEIEGMEIPPAQPAAEDPFGMGLSPFAPLPPLTAIPAGAESE